MKVKIFKRGDFRKIEKLLNGAKVFNPRGVLNRFGRAGVEALSSSTPVDTGLTASCWSYTIEEKNGNYKLIWKNSNLVDNIPIAILLQYGHATRNGGFVEGIDYINPALRRVFEQLADAAWKEVKRQ